MCNEIYFESTFRYSKLEIKLALPSVEVTKEVRFYSDFEKCLTLWNFNSGQCLYLININKKCGFAFKTF